MDPNTDGGMDLPTAASAGSGPVGSHDATLRVVAITDADAFQALAPAWDAILRATPDYTGLQSHDFLTTWWQQMGGDHALWVLAFYRGTALVGLAPLQIAARTMLGKLYRVVEFLGMPEDILLPRPLFPRADEPALRAALIDYLASHAAAWDHIKLDEIADDSPWLADLRELSRRCHLIHREAPLHLCPYLDLTTDEATFWESRSRKLIKNVRASERKLRRLGELEVRTCATDAEIVAGFDELMQVEARSWKREAKRGLSLDPRYGAFYRQLLALFAERHGARVMVMRLDGQPIAATCGLLFDGVYCSLQIVHDEAFNRYSPGTLLEYHEMRELLADPQVRRYEFLGGAPTNKLRWTSDVRGSVYVHARKLGVRALLHDTYKFRARPLAKQMLAKGGLSVPGVRSAYRRIEALFGRRLGGG